MMVISILPHKEEAALADSSIQHVGSFEPTGFSRWWFSSWDVCDLCCLNLFRKTRFAYRKAIEWSAREEEFVKRAGFALMATLAVHDKKENDSVFLEFLPVIEKEASDERNFVKKAVNWALRQIGKRNKALNSLAIESAERIQMMESKSARWIARDALRELGKEKIHDRLKN